MARSLTPAQRQAAIDTIQTSISHGQFIPGRSKPATQLSDAELARRAGYIERHTSQKTITPAMTRGHERIREGKVHRTAEHGVLRIDKDRFHPTKFQTGQPGGKARPSYRSLNEAAKSIRGGHLRISIHGKHRNYSPRAKQRPGDEVDEWRGVATDKATFERFLYDPANMRLDGTPDLPRIADALTGQPDAWIDVDSITFTQED